jgi:hypothetical protein
MKNNRRQFLIFTTAGVATLALNGKAQAQAMLSTTDPQAMALGYVTDHTKADKTKFPNFVAGSRCGTCALYQGAANSASGPCSLYPGKQVAGNGWCSAFQKKA